MDKPARNQPKKRARTLQRLTLLFRPSSQEAGFSVRQREATLAEIEAKSGKKKEAGVFDPFQSVEKDARRTARERAFR
jgi:hypothetical protein